MRYEVIKDKEDLYVLVINNIVVLVSRDLNAITNEIHNDAENRLINPKRTYDPAIIDAETSEKEIIEDKPTEIDINSDKTVNIFGTLHDV